MRSPHRRHAPEPVVAGARPRSRGRARDPALPRARSRPASGLGARGGGRAPRRRSPGRALAAGETPSPQLVADAGETTGLTPRAALVGLAVVVAGLLLTLTLGPGSIGSSRCAWLRRRSCPPKARRYPGPPRLPRRSHGQRPRLHPCRRRRSIFREATGPSGLEPNPRGPSFAREVLVPHESAPHGGVPVPQRLADPRRRHAHRPAADPVGHGQPHSRSRRAGSSSCKRSHREKEDTPREVGPPDWQPLFAAAELDPAQLRPADAGLGLAGGVGRAPGLGRHLARLRPAPARGGGSAFTAGPCSSGWSAPGRSRNACRPGKTSRSGGSVPC